MKREYGRREGNKRGELRKLKENERGRDEMGEAELKREKTTGGETAGEEKPYQLSSKEPSRPCAEKVGILAKAGERSAVVTAKARKVPASSEEPTAAAVPNIKSTWPPNKSFNVGPSPR